MEAHSPLHIAMCPWFALGHITSFLHISNKLAKKGHKISFFIPTKTQSKVSHFNLFPHLISFVPITIPLVDGLPPGSETTNDVPRPLIPLIMTAMDRAEPDFEILLHDLKPDIVFFDSAHWIPKLARRLSIKSVFYITVSAVAIGFNLSRNMKLGESKATDVAEAMQPPPGFPDSSIKRLLHEARDYIDLRSKPLGPTNMRIQDRIYVGVQDCDALAFKSCREIEGPFVEYLERLILKPLLLAGPVLPVRPLSTLEEKWANWLGGFKPCTVVYCAFGSETALRKDQLQELLLGLELSGLPFLAALRPPLEVATLKEALPEGFEERVRGRGVVHEGWIQQQLMLEHKSVGCFVTHCGWGSLVEGLLNGCELVMIPQVGDQVLNARLMGNNLKVGVEVAKGEEDGLFTRESVCNAIRTVMEENYSEVGREIRANRAKLQDQLFNKDEEYIDEFSRKLVLFP
ncbi:UDP-glycosyltransferase [Morus notabilis]|uniref:UDP-glycosyltransferase n=1 Tax=Morus notabilis TaxID=981085 RepID=W9QU12_9ROSA|nr:anthocyanidin 3-O-glucoside 2''-O-glucosyltransferase [Morus notabilis]XP_024019507.1 anthocyanidin 3-O-glucoside 2''-O-glucosyltransferase [Morus notabilis]EXB54128.1 UDP-glycosyltransferase [Morus notabilis]